MTSEDGTPLRLAERSPRRDTPYLPLVANTRNASGVAPVDLHEAAVRGLSRWEEAAEGGFAWDYWQGEDAREHPASLAYDGVSTLFFASAATDDLGLGAETVAYTQLWLDAQTLEIIESDVVLNDLAYAFTADPRAADYAASASTDLVWLDDVITHELGHALGFDHTGLLKGTEFNWRWNDQATLGCDDRAAARAVYGGGGGTLAGRVAGPGGPVHGAQVTAISADRFTPYAATLTDRDGGFALRGLEPGDYHVLVEPFYGRGANLSAYWRDVDPAICDGRLFARTFLTTDGATLERHAVGEGVRDLGEVDVSCADGADVPGLAAEAGPVPLLRAGSRRFGVVDRAEPGEVAWYRLDDVEGTLAVAGLDWSLFSPVGVELALHDLAGGEVAAYAATPMVEDDRTPYANHDALLVAEGLPRGSYLLSVRAERLALSEYPRGDLFVDDRPFVVLLGRHGGDVDVEGLVSGALSECWTDEDFGAYASPDRGPGRRRAACGCASPAPADGALALALLAVLRRRRPQRGRWVSSRRSTSADSAEACGP